MGVKYLYIFEYFMFFRFFLTNLDLCSKRESRIFLKRNCLHSGHKSEIIFPKIDKTLKVSHALEKTVKKNRLKKSVPTLYSFRFF